MKVPLHITDIVLFQLTKSSPLPGWVKRHGKFLVPFCLDGCGFPSSDAALPLLNGDLFILLCELPLIYTFSWLLLSPPAPLLACHCSHVCCAERSLFLQCLVPVLGITSLPQVITEPELQSTLTDIGSQEHIWLYSIQARCSQV